MSSKETREMNVNIQLIPSQMINDYIFIDVREKMELFLEPVRGVECVHLATSQFSSWDYEFLPEKKYLLFCAHGLRSLSCVERLRADGIDNVQSIMHGVAAVNDYFSSSF